MCPNSELCGLLLRRDLAVHEREKCAFRIVRCHSCEDPFPLNELQDHLEQNCPDALISCVNNCLTKEIRRSELVQHLTCDCEHAPVTCPFAVHGCDRVVLRGLLADHLKEDLVNHLMMMKNLVEEQQNEITNLRNKVRELQVAPPCSINLQQIQEVVCERLEAYQPVIQRIHDDVRPYLRWSSLFWFVLAWFFLMSVHGLVRVALFGFVCVKGYKRYANQLRRQNIGRDLVCQRKIFKGVYIGVCLLLFLIVMKVC